MKQRVNLHIDKLVLRGFNREDRQEIAEGIQQELNRMLANPQTVHQLTANGNVSWLRTDKVSIGHGARPRHVGLQIAQGIGKGTKK